MCKRPVVLCEMCACMLGDCWCVCMHVYPHEKRLQADLINKFASQTVFRRALKFPVEDDAIIKAFVYLLWKMYAWSK